MQPHISRFPAARPPPTLVFHTAAGCASCGCVRKGRAPPRPGQLGQRQRQRLCARQAKQRQGDTSAAYHWRRWCRWLRALKQHRITMNHSRITTGSPARRAACLLATRTRRAGG